MLVEPVRTASGPRQKVICSLGDLRARPPTEWLELVGKVEAALVGQPSLANGTDGDVERMVRRVRANTAASDLVHSRRIDELVAIRTDQVSTERHREAGPVHVGYQMWQRLGLDSILAHDYPVESGSN